MVSKYEGFWQDMIGRLRRGIEAAAAGRPVELNISGVRQHGERQSWYGTALVRGGRVLDSHMAHVTALAKLVVTHGLTARYPEHTLRFDVDKPGTRLRITAARSGTADDLAPQQRHSPQQPPPALAKRPHPRGKGSAMKIGLVGCVKDKLPRPAPARDLYISPLFRGRRRAVEASCDRWFILSAKHRLLAPDTVTAPYDLTLRGAPTARKRQWASQVLAQLVDELGDVKGLVFDIHAGKDYYGFGLADGLRTRGATVDIPTAHLGQGQQGAYYKRLYPDNTPADRGLTRQTARASNPGTPPGPRLAGGRLRDRERRPDR